MKVLILIDGDNIDENFVPAIYKEAGSYLQQDDIFEAHCFCDFLKKKQNWRTAFCEYGVQLHYIPGFDKQKGKPDPNTSDIALTAFAVKKLYENPELETVIVVANDKDYVPLAKVIMEEHNKRAVMFYTQANDTAVKCYTKAVLLKGESQETQKPKKAATSKASESSQSATESLLVNCIEELFEVDDEVLLAELGPILKEKKIKYNSLGKYLEDMFDQFPALRKKYVLKLGNKRDRIERKVK